MEAFITNDTRITPADYITPEVGFEWLDLLNSFYIFYCRNVPFNRNSFSKVVWLLPSIGIRLPEVILKTRTTKVRFTSLKSFSIVCNGLNHESYSTGIPPENTFVQKPVFFGAALRDYVVIAPIFIQSVITFSNSSLSIHEYNSGHWVMLEVKDEVNSDLLQWIEGLALDG
jgi:hypothetical protein